MWIMKLSAAFFSSARKMPQKNLKTGPNRFLSRPFQFFFHNDPMSRTTIEVALVFTNNPAMNAWIVMRYSMRAQNLTDGYSMVVGC